MPWTELSDIPETFDELVPLTQKEGKKEIHVFRKYFITKRNENGAASNPFSETVWTIDIERDMMFRMRVQSPNVNFKLILSTLSGEILSDAPSIMGYGASISNLITTDRVGSDRKVQVKFHFYDFLKTPEEIVEHEDVHDCHLPHIILEMSIMSKDEFISRKKVYSDNLPSGSTVKFPDIDNNLIGYHEASYGNTEDEETSMKLSDDDNLYSLTTTSSDLSGKFEIVKEYHITISSEEERTKNKNALPLMYYLQLQIVADFMTSGSMHVVIVHEKDDADPLVQKDNLFAYDSLNCAEDLVWVVSQKSAKNVETLNVALTEGNYGIYFVDYQHEGMRNFIANNVKLIPFSSIINLYPVETQDNSIYCDGLAVPNPYFVPYVIDGGHKFDQRIEIDFRNTTQDIYFDVDTTGSTEGLIVRVTTEQDIGMDVDITIFDYSNNQIAKGKDIGATETVVFKAKSSGKYKVQLSYRNSIIRDLMSCPQVHLYVSSLTDTLAKGLGKIQSDQLSGSTTSYQSIESLFSQMQNAINSGIPYSNDIDFDTIYVFQRESYSDLEEDIYTNKLVLKDKPYWIYIEIFCDQVFNDIVVNIDFEDKRFSKTTSIEKKLNAGKTDELLRSQKALHLFSMVMSYQDNYDIQFISRNLLGDITGYDEQLKHVMFQMKVHVNPLGKEEQPLTMTSLLPKSFNNFRDLGIYGVKNDEIRYFREKLLLNTKERNSIDMEIVKPTKMRVFLKTLASEVSIKRVYLKDSSSNEISGNVIEQTFDDIDVSYDISKSGNYTLYISTGAKTKKYGEFFMKLEMEPTISRQKCSSEVIPQFNDIAITTKRSEITQETHYYVGNSMFRNVYHLGQKQIGTPHDIYKVNFPTSSGKNYIVIPFTLEKRRNLLTVNIFHDWSEDLIKIYVIKSNEDPQDLYDIIRNLKTAGLNQNVQDVDTVIQSTTLEYFEGIEKQYIPKGDYKLVIMHMDPNTDSAPSSCVMFAMSIYIEEMLAKKDSRVSTGLIVSTPADVDETTDEAVIESISLCTHGFMAPQMFKNVLKVNGGVLSFDSIFRFDNDERWKKLEFEVTTNSVLYFKITDISNKMSELDVSILVATPQKANSYEDHLQVVANKRADETTKTVGEKFVEIQKFVKKGKYLLDFTKSVFDLDTELFPCNQVRFEIEIRPLTDIPDVLKSDETCSDDEEVKSGMAEYIGNIEYNKMVRIDNYFSISENVIKKFRFKISEPTFLFFMTSFEKELSGGSMTLSISHVKNITNPKTSKSKSGLIPILFSSDTGDGISFLHESLDPGISGDLKLDSEGEYIITVSGGHKAALTKTLEANNLVPKCSKVSMFYHLSRISDLQNTFNEEFESEAGDTYAGSKIWENIEIDNIQSIQKYIEEKRGENYMDVSGNILIPDPSISKRLAIAIRSLNKPTTSIVRVTVSLPDEIRSISRMKYNLRVLQINNKNNTDFIMYQSLEKHEKDISFSIDDTESKNYVVSIEFEEIDWELLQSHCPFVQIRVAREPLFNVVSLLSQFDTKTKYKDVDTLKSSPISVVINREMTRKFNFFQTVDSVKSKKGRFLGQIEIDVQIDQVQLDIFSEYNYISSSISLEMYGNQSFRDVGTFEIDDEHYNSNQFYTGRNAIRMIGTGDVLPRGKYKLFIKTGDYSMQLLNTITEVEYPSKLTQNIKFPFTIKIESEPINDDLSTQAHQLRLLDIEYNGDPDDDAKSINTDEDLQILCEFNDDLDNVQLKFDKFARLILDKKHIKGGSKNQMIIEPDKIDKIEVKSKNTVLLVFSGENLKKNATYHLSFTPEIGINQELNDADLLTIKTLASDCNSKGVNTFKTKINGICNCKYPYMGPTCTECQDDYVFNTESKECILFETCEEETCSDHGQCTVNQKTGLSECECDPGFTDSEDGTRCSRCISEDQVYPDCSLTKTKTGMRSSVWLGLTANLVPKFMKDSALLWSEKVGDVREFSRTYSVTSGITTESLDLPVIDEATLIKIFYKGSDGLSLSVKILDSNQTILFESAKPYSVSTTSAIMNPEVTTDGANVDRKGTVVFEYTFNEKKISSEEEKDIKPCFSSQVIISMVPYSEFIENSLWEQVKKLEASSELTKQSSNLYDLYEFRLGNEPISIDQAIIVENEKVKIRLKPEMSSVNDNAFGNIFVSMYYDLQFMSLSAKLMKSDGSVQKFVKYGKTDAFEPELGTSTSLSQVSNMITHKLDNEFYGSDGSYLEAEFVVSRSFLELFDTGDNSNNDLWFAANLQLEYIPPKSANSVEDDDYESQISYIEPALLNDIPIQKFHNITIEIGLSQSIIEAYPGIDPDSSFSGTMISQMCALESSEGSDFVFYDFDYSFFYSKSNTIYPIEYSVSEEFDKIFLHFPVSQAYENTCYKLVCRNNPTVVSSDYFDVKETAKVQTKYWFADEVDGTSMISKKCQSCNSLGTRKWGSKGQCIWAHPYTGTNWDQCADAFEVTTLPDGKHKCIKSNSKCSPDFWNFKGSCELKKDEKGIISPTCTCSDLYDGRTCSVCKDKTMQFPGCHTPKQAKLQKDSEDGSTKKVNQVCMDAIPSTLDTYEDLRYNGEALLSGVYSLSEENKSIKIMIDGGNRKKSIDCLSGTGNLKAKVYLEYLEESYINKRIPITFNQTSMVTSDAVDKGEKTNKIAPKNTFKISSAVKIPSYSGSNSVLRGEYLEVDIIRVSDTTTGSVNTYTLNFDLRSAMKSGLNFVKNGCLQVYLEVTIIPSDRILTDSTQCNSDHNEPNRGKIFSSTDVLKINPGYDYSSVMDSTGNAFASNSYAYKENDGLYFHQKDIELVDSQVQNLDFRLLQNFGTSKHLLGLILEIPLDANHDNFMHGENEPDCINNECIFSDKSYDGSSINYVFNGNNVSRIRIWFYRITTASSSDSCTSYHFTLKSTENYQDTTSKEKVAWLDEVFPTQLTVRRFEHKEIPYVYIINDNFRVDSFIPDSQGNTVKSSFSLTKPSLVKIIIAKQYHELAYSLLIFKSDGASESLKYSTNNMVKSQNEIEPNDIRVSILLPEGRYSIKIKAIFTSRTIFRTCHSVRIFVGIMPKESIKESKVQVNQTSLPDLSFLLQNQTNSIRAKLANRKAEKITVENRFKTDPEVIQSTTIKYSGGSGKIGLYYEISENNDPSQHVEIGEISAGLYPDLEVEAPEDDTKKNTGKDIPIISTSTGKTYIYITNLKEDKKYTLKIMRHKLLTTTDDVNADIFSIVNVNAYLYSANKESEVKSAKIEINGNVKKLPVQPWIPSCGETVLTNNLLRDVVLDVITTGITFTEILVLNEEQTRVATPFIELKDMIDKESILVISASPYDVDTEDVIEEFMISATAKGNKAINVRSQQFDGGVYLAQIDLSKADQTTIAVRINYALNDERVGGLKLSQCNMIRFHVEVIPKSATPTINSLCSGSFESSIKSIIPDSLPDPSKGSAADQSIAYEYASSYSPSPKFKIDPYKADQNKIKFTLNKASNFRFEMIYYPCMASPIVRNLKLTSVSKTHNKILRDTIAGGIPSIGSSLLLYVDELVPGSYELEIQYGWLKDMDTSKFTNIMDAVDFQIEIYSLHQNDENDELASEKDRHIRELETMIRDHSVVSFINKKNGQYIGEFLSVPTHPPAYTSSLVIPFKIVPNSGQVLINSIGKFKYLDSIELQYKSSKSMIKRMHGDTENYISEVLQQGDYIIQFNYKTDNVNYQGPKQLITFGISDYENIKLYKTCNSVFTQKCDNSILGTSAVMMKANSGMVPISFESDTREMLNIQLHYNKFLTQTPIKLYLDKINRPVTNEYMKHMMMEPGNHTLYLVGPQLSLDETCILISMVEYELPMVDTEISQMPGIEMKSGIQSVVVSNLKKGSTSLALPNFKENPDEGVFSSTLIIDFSRAQSKIKTPNIVELDMNFDTDTEFNYQPQVYYENSRDKIISYIDISTKPGADVLKQFEVIHNKDFPNGEYLAHLAIFNGDDIGAKFDKCNVDVANGKAQLLDQSATFLYTSYGKEDFGLALTPETVTATNSKFYDSGNNLFFLEIVYQISQPAFIEMIAEFDIALQNVELYVFQDFNINNTVEDQELSESFLDIPSSTDSLALRQTSVYLSAPGKYSIFVVDKKLPKLMKLMSEFDDEKPWAMLKISHSIQKFSSDKLVDSSLLFLSVYPRRIGLDLPSFYQVQSERSFVVTVYPNSLDIDPLNPPKIQFSIVDVKNGKKLYKLEPDRTNVVTPSRTVQTTSGLEKFIKEIKIECFFKKSTLQDVIGANRIMTLDNPDMVSDISMMPYYVILDSKDKKIEDIDTGERKAIVNPEKTSSTQPVKEKLTLKQRRHKLTTTLDVIEACEEKCVNGDCNENGECVCRTGFYGTNWDNKRKIGDVEKMREKTMEAAKPKSTKSTSRSNNYEEDDENYDWDDDDRLDSIQATKVYGVQGYVDSPKPTTQESKAQSIYGWFDYFLLLLLILGIALIFYQNLWDGRFCRKKLKKKLKYDDEDPNDQEDKAIIKEEFDYMGGGTVELPRVRNAKIQ